MTARTHPPRREVPPDLPVAEAFESLREHLEHADRQCVEWCPLCRAADVLREHWTPELQEQWESVQREALTTVRGLIDHYLERLEDQPAHHAQAPNGR
jgi:hypothetical protein